MSATVFYLLRHAPALAPGFPNRERPLTPQGWQQARALAPFLRNLKLDACYASPYRRAQDTLVPLAADGPPLRRHEGLRESTADEKLPQVRRRLVECLRALNRNHGGETLLLCTHGGCLWSVLKHFAEDSLFADYGQITSPDLKRVVWDENPYFDLDFDSAWTARTHIEGSPAFGRLHALYTYRSRPGGYAVVRDGEGRVAVVEAGGGLHLPGGGVDPGESPAAATKREFLEECGLGIDLDHPLGQAHQYVYSTAAKTPFRKECFYFSGHLNGIRRPPTEADHHLHWLPPERVMAELRHGAHSWALRHHLADA